MVNYRRNYKPGGCYFFTVTLQNRKSRILVEHINLLREVMRHVQRKKYYKTEAMVALPYHLHCIWKLPEVDADYPQRWKEIKGYFTHGLKYKGIDIKKNKRSEYVFGKENTGSILYAMKESMSIM